MVVAWYHSSETFADGVESNSQTVVVKIAGYGQGKNIRSKFSSCPYWNLGGRAMKNEKRLLFTFTTLAFGKTTKHSSEEEQLKTFAEV